MLSVIVRSYLYARLSERVLLATPMPRPFVLATSYLGGSCLLPGIGALRVCCFGGRSDFLIQKVRDVLSPIVRLE